MTYTYFMHKDEHYKQIEVCAMGTSTPNLIAQLVIEDLEESNLAK